MKWPIKITIKLHLCLMRKIYLWQHKKKENLVKYMKVFKKIYMDRLSLEKAQKTQLEVRVTSMLKMQQYQTFKTAFKQVMTSISMSKKIKATLKTTMKIMRMMI